MVTAYIAGRYGRRKEFKEYAEILKNYDIDVLSTWLEGKHENKEGHGTRDEMEQWSNDDITDIIRSKLFICFTEDREAGYTSGGRHVEFGYALCLEKKIILIGQRENIFYNYYNIEQFNDFKTFLFYIQDKSVRERILGI